MDPARLAAAWRRAKYLHPHPRRYSTCNSAARGGDLGKFTPGKMVKLTLTLTLALTLTLTLALTLAQTLALTLVLTLALTLTLSLTPTLSRSRLRVVVASEVPARDEDAGHRALLRQREQRGLVRGDIGET